MDKNDSHDTREGRDADDQRHAAEADEAEEQEQQQREQAMGNVLPASGSIPSSDAGDTRAHARQVAQRLQSEGRWAEVAPIRDRMMSEAKKAFPDKESRQAWVYAELDRMYPPLRPDGVSDMVSVSPNNGEDTESGQGRVSDMISESRTDSGAIQGLSDLPGDWPELPSNASLALEVGWVQANRLRIVEERMGRATVVRLDLALSPAPSWAALGWLETSIRSYAKFVDVAAKVSGSTDDEGAVMKRERKSVDEVRALLAEMEEAEGTCPHCGRPR